MTHINEHAQSKALEAIIKDTIANQGGIISFAEYMQLALYHPELGYYHTLAFHPDKGDFITAPEISPLFAQCFARQCYTILSQLNAKNIIEIGAGTGRFAGDLLLALEQMNLSFVQYTIYEPSPYLREQQKNTLQKTYPHLFSRIQWVDTLPANITGIIIANEVLDALPVHCFQIDDHNTIQEKGVIWGNNQFNWFTTTPFTSGLKEAVETLQDPDELGKLPNGYESEINLQIPDFIRSLSNTLTQGVILLADYGYGRREYYHPERTSGTLTCFYRHQYHHQPFLRPGVQDITSHVDFTRVAECAIEYDLTLGGFTNQSSFLLNLGLMQLAEEKEKNLNLSDIKKMQLHQAIKKLVLPSEMGECIKIMALCKNIDDIILPSFSASDRRRDL
jgi:SAM-dependent MidA family methyltransferase